MSPPISTQSCLFLPPQRLCFSDECVRNRRIQTSWSRRKLQSRLRQTRVALRSHCPATPFSFILHSPRWKTADVPYHVTPARLLTGGRNTCTHLWACRVHGRGVKQPVEQQRNNRRRAAEANACWEAWRTAMACSSAPETYQTMCYLKSNNFHSNFICTPNVFLKKSLKSAPIKLNSWKLNSALSKVKHQEIRQRLSESKLCRRLSKCWREQVPGEDD